MHTVIAMQDHPVFTLRRNIFILRILHILRIHSELIQVAKFKTLVTEKMHHWRKVDD